MNSVCKSCDALFSLIELFSPYMTVFELKCLLSCCKYLYTSDICIYEANINLDLPNITRQQYHSYFHHQSRFLLKLLNSQQNKLTHLSIFGRSSVLFNVDDDFNFMSFILDPIFRCLQSLRLRNIRLPCIPRERISYSFEYLSCLELSKVDYSSSSFSDIFSISMPKLSTLTLTPVPYAYQSQLPSIMTKYPSIRSLKLVSFSVSNLCLLTSDLEFLILHDNMSMSSFLPIPISPSCSAMRTFELRHLDVSRTLINFTYLQAMMRICDHLQVLNASMLYPSYDKVIIESKSLTHVDLRSNTIKGLKVEAPLLQVLELSGSTISRLRVSSSHILTLDLRGLTSLLSLNLQCTQLQECQLQGCGMLGVLGDDYEEFAWIDADGWSLGRRPESNVTLQYQHIVDQCHAIPSDKLASCLQGSNLYIIHQQHNINRSDISTSSTVMRSASA